MKKSIIIFAVLLFFSGKLLAQVDTQHILENAKKQYIEITTKAYKDKGLPVDSTVLNTGLAQIEKMFNSTIKTQQQSQRTQTNTITTKLNPNQCLLSDGSIYTVGCGFDENKKKLGNISLPLNGQVSGTTLLFTKDLESLHDILLDVATKWREWDQVAKDNGVDKLTKELPVKLPKCSATWVLNHFWSSKIEEQSLYYTLNNGKSTVSIVGAYRATLNNLVTNNATYSWKSPEDIEKVAEIVDVNNLTSYLQRKSATNDLFK